MMIATKNLPAQLKSLVRNVLNVNTVEVVLHAGPAELWTSWRTGRIESLGTVLKTVTDSHRGCDGESNDSTVTSYTLPVAVGTPKCGRGTKNRVTLHIGNLGAALASKDAAQLTTEALAVLLDASLANEAKPEQVKFECDLVADWEGNDKQIVRFTGRETGKATMWLSESSAERVLAHWMGYCDRSAPATVGVGGLPVGAAELADRMGLTVDAAPLGKAPVAAPVAEHNEFLAQLGID